MAALPDPTDTLKGTERAMFDHMASARANADGRARLAEVYVCMFNNPGVATSVGALGEHLRFHGALPDAVRELVILRYSARQGYGYEWSHHQRPAKLAGISQEVIDALAAGQVPDTLPDALRSKVNRRGAFAPAASAVSMKPCQRRVARGSSPPMKAKFRRPCATRCRATSTPAA